MSAHLPVLLNEVIEGLDLSPSDTVIDATVNGGGHAEAITSILSDTGVFIGIDLDKSAIEASSLRLKNAQAQITLCHDSFKNIDSILNNLELQNADKILFDLGWSSNQFEKAERGFSFNLDGPLLMTLADDPNSVEFTAYDIINTWDEDNIRLIFESYGEEKYTWRICKAIVEERKKTAIISTLQLAEIIKQAVPKKYANGKNHPATKCFQALRIAVNNEIEVLKDGLKTAFDSLSINGRILVISFHSVEDRVVKNYFRELKSKGVASIITKKPIVATKNELEENRRARSAKLRIIKKI